MAHIFGILEEIGSSIISRHFFTPFFSFAIESYIYEIGSPIISRHFFLLQLTPTYMKRVLHLVSVKNITFKSSCNWFKIDILWQLRPLTANYMPMFIVTSTTIYTGAKCQVPAT